MSSIVIALQKWNRIAKQLLLSQKDDQLAKEDMYFYAITLVKAWLLFIKKATVFLLKLCLV
ncbi:hypothetical protein [Nostoc sp. TCL26-01]|uniref:hypothetical protein n=1 Tax=Nostoc sp. TCL26-01 TaxID=2576904 RepID=UPI0015B79A17|nr:hypothetical protein [Nostoc sp. TCL26-01]